MTILFEGKIMEGGKAVLKHDYDPWARGKMFKYFYAEWIIKYFPLRNFPAVPSFEAPDGSIK